MKICFLLQRRFAYIGYEIARHLYHQYGIKEFCGYVQVRQSFNFLKEQTAPEFSGLLLDEEIHNRYKTEKIDWNFMKKLETEFGLPNLWPYVELDRVVRSSQLIRAYPYDQPRYSHEDMIKIVQVKAKAIIKFLDEEKPDAIVFSVIGSIGSLLLYEMAKKRNIKTLVVMTSRLGVKYILSESYLNFSFAKDIFKKLRAESLSLPEEEAQAKKFLNEFRLKPAPFTKVDLPNIQPINRLRQFRFLFPANFIKSFSWRLRMTIRYLLDSYRSDYSNINPFFEAWDNFKKKIRVLIGYNDLYDKIETDENFAFFPLHFEPEVATLLYAPFYKDQIWLIKQIARSLPINLKLYIKEHPSMVGYRTRAFYKELKKIPNLKLIHPSYESLPLISQAKLILTITGTAGWEAIKLNRPVIVFGEVFYGELPGVKKCRTIDELPYLVKDQLENFKPDDESLIDFIAAIYHESVDVDLTRLWDIEAAANVEKKKSELLPLADLIAKKLKLEYIKK